MLFLFNVIGLALAFSIIIGYVALKLSAYIVGNKLRTPPTKWREYLHQALVAGAKSLPDFGSKTGAIRRQLILVSPNVSYYTNILPLSIAKVPKGAFATPAADKRKKKTIFGFFHPNANAGGGGERVLWAAVKQTLENSESNVCAIYVSAIAGSTGTTPRDILTSVQVRFGLDVDESRVLFIYLTQGNLINPQSWPFMTILGQAFGSAVLGYEAISNLIPDVFVDTQGLPFCYPLISMVLNIPIFAYVHYPIVSSDMLKKLRFTQVFKHVYWRLMMIAYAFAGSFCTVVATNSTWTQNHIKQRWWYGHKAEHIKVIYPPCATQDFEFKPGSPRSKSITYVAQFRPEKRHELLLQEFAKFIKVEKNKDTHLILIGSVRNNDDKQYVYSLRLLARSLDLDDDNLTFVLDAPWESVKKMLESSWVGINTMWNEHFGMVVVEYMAAGLIPIAHASAGPLLDIIGVDSDFGILFKSPDDPDYTPADSKWPTLSEALTKAFSFSDKEVDKKRIEAHEKAQKFSDEAFASNWNKAVETLLKLNTIRSNSRRANGSFD